jgi:hypothetical protein
MDDTILETVELDCVEENRTATLLVEWRIVNGKKTVVGVQCDNPRLGGLKPWDCGWSCWHRLEE